MSFWRDRRILKFPAAPRVSLAVAAQRDGCFPSGNASFLSPWLRALSVVITHGEYEWRRYMLHCANTTREVRTSRVKRRDCASAAKRTTFAIRPLSVCPTSACVTFATFDDGLFLLRAPMFRKTSPISRCWYSGTMTMQPVKLPSERSGYWRYQYFYGVTFFLCRVVHEWGAPSAIPQFVSRKMRCIFASYII